MAVKNFKAGVSIPFSFDASEMSSGTAMLVEIAQNNRTIEKFRYPLTTGFSELTKDGDIYSGVLTSEMTSTMKGLYHIEITRYDDDEEVDKGSAPLLNITLESK